MYHSYYFLNRLTRSLAEVLPGSSLIDCFSQEKDELVLAFATPENEAFYIRADLAQGRGHLSFPDSFSRTRGPSADVFPQLLGGMVQKLVQTQYDRSFVLVFEQGLELVFKLYGGRSNLLLYRNRVLEDVFNHHLKKDLETPFPQPQPAPSGYSPDVEELWKMYPTFHPDIRDAWLEQIRKGEAGPLAFQRFLTQLEGSGPLYLFEKNKKVKLSFFPSENPLFQSDNPIEIANRFVRLYWQVDQFHKEKDLLQSDLDQRIFESGEMVKRLERQWMEGEEAKSYRLQADVLMAYGQQIEKGQDHVELTDFSGNPIRIRLKPDLSIPANAERLYKKARGQQQDQNRIEQKIQEWQTRQNQLREVRLALDNCRRLEDLRQFRYRQEMETPEQVNLPYHQKFHLGYEIWIGKNAKSNDEMLRLAHKDDWWLHARSVAGSHVIIRRKKGQTTPLPVQERAAQWAAFYSKGRTEGLCPVMITERKYVRKGKGMAAGQVKVEKEKTILVQPME